MADRVTPVDELRESASRLRKLVADLPDDATAPWRQVFTDTDSLSGLGICADHLLGEHGACDNCWTVETWQEGLAAYLQTMHPSVALALAELFETFAGHLNLLDAAGLMSINTAMGSRTSRPVLALARAYLDAAKQG